MNQPDPKKHFQISMLKSGIRIVGCIYLSMGWVVAAGLVLLVAEGVGIWEELV